MTNRTRAAIYCRISNDREGRELGVQRQEDDCRAFAERLGVFVTEVFVDNDHSASTRSRKERPEFERMIELAESGEIKTILAYSSSRLTRRPMEHERLIPLCEEHGITIRTIKAGDYDYTTARGRRRARDDAARDAEYAEEIAELVSRASLQRAERGEWHGGRVAPLGYRLIKDARDRVTTLELDPVYAPLLQEAARRLLKGESLYAVTIDWNARGITTREGARWVSATLRRALLSPSAIGKREHKSRPGELFDTEWPALLDRKTWDRLHALMGDPGRKFPSLDGSYSSKYALGGGVAVCGHVVDGQVCGKKLVSQKHRGVVRLICSTQATGGCGRVLITYPPLEEFVLDLVLARLDSPQFQRALASRPVVTDDQEQRLREDLADLNRQRERVAMSLEIGARTKAQAAQRIREIDEEQAKIKSELQRLAASHVVSEVSSAQDALELWEDADVNRRRRFISSYVERVEVVRHPVGRATTLTRRRGEEEDAFLERRHDHERETLRQRVKIVWRR